MGELCLNQRSKDLKRGEEEVVVATMVLFGLSETEKPEACAWNVRNLEVHSHGFVVQVVVVSTVNFCPQGSIV